MKKSLLSLLSLCMFIAVTPACGGKCKRKTKAEKRAMHHKKHKHEGYRKRKVVTEETIEEIE